MKANFLFMINVITWTKDVYGKGRRLKFWGTVHYHRNQGPLCLRAPSSASVSVHPLPVPYWPLNLPHQGAHGIPGRGAARSAWPGCLLGLRTWAREGLRMGAPEGLRMWALKGHCDWGLLGSVWNWNASHSKWLFSGSWIKNIVLCCHRAVFALITNS